MRIVRFSPPGPPPSETLRRKLLSWQEKLGPDRVWIDDSLLARALDHGDEEAVDQLSHILVTHITSETPNVSERIFLQCAVMMVAATKHMPPRELVRLLEMLVFKPAKNRPKNWRARERAIFFMAEHKKDPSQQRTADYAGVKRQAVSAWLNDKLFRQAVVDARNDEAKRAVARKYMPPIKPRTR